MTSLYWISPQCISNGVMSFLLWLIDVVIFWYCWSASFVSTLHYLIIIIMQTYLKVMNFQNAGQVHHVDVVSQNKSFLLIVFHAIHGLCVFSLPISLVRIVRIYVIYLIIIIRSEVGTICHCLRSGNETVVCAVCLSLFLWTQTFSRSSVTWDTTPLMICIPPRPYGTYPVH